VARGGAVDLAVAGLQVGEREGAEDEFGVGAFGEQVGQGGAAVDEGAAAPGIFFVEQDVAAFSVGFFRAGFVAPAKADDGAVAAVGDEGGSAEVIMDVTILGEFAHVAGGLELAAALDAEDVFVLAL